MESEREIPEAKKPKVIFKLLIDQSDYDLIKEAKTKTGKPMTRIIIDGAKNEAVAAMRRQKIGISSTYSNQ